MTAGYRCEHAVSQSHIAHADHSQFMENALCQVHWIAGMMSGKTHLEKTPEEIQFVVEVNFESMSSINSLARPITAIRGQNNGPSAASAAAGILLQIVVWLLPHTMLQTYTVPN